MAVNLRGKGVLVTGGGSGIGQSIAVSLAEEGCKVAVAGRGEERLRETVALWKGQPPILHCPVDVADRKSVGKLFAWADTHLGPIDILVNSAGVNTKNRTMADLTPEDWDRVLAINATGTFNCIYAAVGKMRERGGGLIINISSVAGKRASSLGGVPYSASKFAMTGLGTAVGLEEIKNGIRVTNIYPGEVDTPILENRPAPITAEHRARMLKAEDVAAAVLMVARLPNRAHVPELVIKPNYQTYM